MSRYALALTLLSLCAGCAPTHPSTDDGAGLTFYPVTDRLTVRKVEATDTHLQDWGNRKMIDSALAADGTLEVHYCEKHFPTGSQALANLKTAVDAYNQIPGLSFAIPVLAEEGTSTTHPDLSTFEVSKHTIYVDYDDLKDGAWAGTSLPTGSCHKPTTADAPLACNKAHIYAAADKYESDDHPFDTNYPPPSVGVFMHELGHAFGQGHMDAFTVDPESMLYDRVTIHGPKHHGDDPRETYIQAATLAFLRTWYSDSSTGLDTDELTAHPVMGLADLTTGEEVEFTPAKDHIQGTRTLSDGLNETKLRWDSARGSFVACSTGEWPLWLGRYSDLSTNAVSKDYAIAFSVSTVEAPTTSSPSQWTRVATRSGLHSYDAGESDFRQLDWRRTLTITAANVALPSGGPAVMTKRKLGFAVDPDNTVVERREGNNSWSVTLCLYPESDAACAAPCEQ